MMESGKWKAESGKWSCRTRTALLFSLSVLLLTASCAKQGYPSGGPKDTKAPQALGSKPINKTRHFDKQQFYIEFDEYVVLKDADNNILVSPPLKQKPEYNVKGKGVQVKLHDTLLANTTYLFQFKGAIADYTEGNVLQSYEYVFSTGDAMDTMTVAGRVLKARDGKPWKETVTVAAYKADNGAALNDTVATTDNPDFVTRCNDSGFFAFHYIPAGDYRLVAFEDKDRDLRVGRSEAMAFDSRIYSAADSIDSTALPLLKISQPEQRQQRLLKSDFTERGHITIVTLLPMQSPNLSGEAVEWRLNNRRDTMTVWCLNEQCDSTVLVISDTATALQDTMKLRYRIRSKARPLGGTKTRQQQRITTLCDGSKAYYDDLRLAFKNPVATVRDNAMAEVMNEKDSSLRMYPVVLDSGGVTAHIEASLTAGERYRVHMRDSLFTDIYGHAYDSLSFNLTPKDYGILTLLIANTIGSPLVVEVLDSRDTVVQRQATRGGTLKFTHLPAAEYRLRAVVDRNGDGQWTPGDYRKQRQPEECIPFEKTLKLREKWEMEEKWVLKIEN